jgi:hypothetical protein
MDRTGDTRFGDLETGFARTPGLLELIKRKIGAGFPGAD